MFVTQRCISCVIVLYIIIYMVNVTFFVGYHILVVCDWLFWLKYAFAISVTSQLTCSILLYLCLLQFMREVAAVWKWTVEERKGIFSLPPGKSVKRMEKPPPVPVKQHLLLIKVNFLISICSVLYQASLRYCKWPPYFTVFDKPLWSGQDTGRCAGELYIIVNLVL